MKDYDEELGHSVCCLEAELTSMAVCGLGPSGVPHCTPTIELQPPLEAKPVGDAALRPTFAGDELVLGRADGKPVDDKKSRLHPSLRAVSGRHHLVFP